MKFLNLIYFICVSITTLIIFGFLPREASFFVLLLYCLFIVFYPAGYGASLVIRSIPFFIALPLTDSFDNFNTWRVVIFLLFLKWGLEKGRILSFLPNILNLEYWKEVFRVRRLEVWGGLFLIFSALSIFVGVNYEGGILRVIYLVNIALLFVIIRSLVSEDENISKRFFKDFVIGVALAVVFGYIQFLMSYFTDAGTFHYWWGAEVSLAQYGAEWSNIVLNSGNTWLSYAGETLRLRMFSVFPDTHSFPMFVIMSLPSMFALYFLNKSNKKIPRANILYVVALAFLYLALILSGTRGIWLSVLFTLVLAVFFYLRAVEGRRYARYILLSFLVFVLMFFVYFGISSFRQFQDTEFTTSASIERFQSIIDIGETSNSGRIYIWKKSINYIKREPIWGVGVANFPLILQEPLTASLAGSSAHNLYLHIAATTGIPSLIFALLFLYELVAFGFRGIKEKCSWRSFYFAGAAFSVFWLAAYLMTDAALFDERAFLGFMVMSGIATGIFGFKNKIKHKV